MIRLTFCFLHNLAVQVDGRISSNYQISLRLNHHEQMNDKAKIRSNELNGWFEMFERMFDYESVADALEVD